MIKLNKMYEPYIRQERGYANGLFLGFLNYLILNMDTVNELLFNREVLHSTYRDFYFDENREAATAVYHDIIDDNPAMLAIYSDGVFDNTELEHTYRTKLHEYLYNSGIDSYTAGGIAMNSWDYLDVLTGIKKRQSDFALSDAFIKLVNGYFSEDDYSEESPYELMLTYYSEKMERYK